MHPLRLLKSMVTCLKQLNLLGGRVPNFLRRFALVGALCASSAQGALLELAQQPLFMGASVAPNVFFQLDDSGSMDWEFMLGSHWHVCSYQNNINGQSSSTDCGYINTSGIPRFWANSYWRNGTYVYQNGQDNAYNDRCVATTQSSLEACDVMDQDWRSLSSSLNRIYYTPDSTYQPWEGPCNDSTAECPQAQFGSARSNPREGSVGYTTQRNLQGFTYHVWVDDKGFSGERPRRGTYMNATNVPNGMVDLWDSHVAIQVNATNASLTWITYTPTTNHLGESSTLLTTLVGGACYDALGPEANVLGILNTNGNWAATNGPGCRTLADAQNNIANWYSYARKRSYVAKSAISSVISGAPNLRYGLSLINSYDDLFIEVPDEDDVRFSLHNKNLLRDLYRFVWTPSGTPLRRGLEIAGRYYDNLLPGKKDPIVHACQQNFTILMTDGYWNGPPPGRYIKDEDKDGISGTLSDVAKYFYDKDLSARENFVIPNKFDQATHQHMVTYGVAFGVQGKLEDTDDDGWPDPDLTENSNWGNPFYSEAETIDDLWHAAFNSKGAYVNAQTPGAVVERLGVAIASITERVTSATAVAQNSTTLQTNSQVYQARFDSGDWHGELIAFRINPDGTIAPTPVWNAACVLTGGSCNAPSGIFPGLAPEERVVITRSMKEEPRGVPFRMPNDYTQEFVDGQPTGTLSRLLRYAPYPLSTSVLAEQAANQQYAEQVVAYLRGDRRREVLRNSEPPVFRERFKILGDIVHSDPLYVSPPSRVYTDDFESVPYSLFKSAYAGRQGLVYTGANDGMLHAFDVDTGEERMAYVPGIRNNHTQLARLTQPGYTHQFSVNGSPTANDIVLNGAWRTVLVSGMRSGGQGVFALDITDPSQFSEDNADQIHLWEFTDEDDPDLGYTHSYITIAQVRHHGTVRWAAFLGNGYNSNEPDEAGAGSGNPYLFVLFMEGPDASGTWVEGTHYLKIPVGSTSAQQANGLSTPYLVDVTGDYGVDFAYAGDLQGNLWKFDFTDPDPVTWQSKVTRLFQAYHEVPGDQPITAPPVVGIHPLGLAQGVMVLVGTGKYLEPSDNTSLNQTTQSFYGLWDPLDGRTLSKDHLLEQQILSESTAEFDLDGDGSADKTVTARLTSDHAIDWQNHQGWYLNLHVAGSTKNQGERQITRPILRNNAVIFTTLMPSTLQCEFGGRSWIMELDAASGSSLEASPFDFNEDGAFDDLDKIFFPYQGQEQLSVASGYLSEVGITATPAVFLTADKMSEVKVISGSTGISSFNENPVNGPKGRQNWRRLK